MKIIKHNTIDELKKEIKRTEPNRYKIRLQTILLSMQRTFYKDILKTLSISSRSYYSWIYRYNKGGLKSLKHYSKGGRPKGSSKYNSQIFIKLFKELDTMQEYWSIIKMQKFIYDTHSVSIPNETLRKIVKRAGYSYKSNRPSPYKGDKEKQETFKKTLSPMWLKT